MIKEVLGFIILMIGLGFSLSSGKFCSFLCKGNCNVSDVSSCYFLFLFVSIILIVSGSCLIINVNRKNEEMVVLGSVKGLKKRHKK